MLDLKFSNNHSSSQFNMLNQKLQVSQELGLQVEDDDEVLIDEIPSLKSFSIYNQPRVLCIHLGIKPPSYS